MLLYTVLSVLLYFLKWLAFKGVVCVLVLIWLLLGFHSRHTLDSDPFEDISFMGGMGIEPGVLDTSPADKK